jgi:mono/diheme cytochrome c family protein
LYIPHMSAVARILAVLLCVAARLPAQSTDPPPPKSPVALGDSLYHAGTCPACHGPDGDGIVDVAPSLITGKWLHVDGSVPAIERIIDVGVEKPKKVAAPMPPNGGMALTPEQRHALAAYVLSLRHASVIK